MSETAGAGSGDRSWLRRVRRSLLPRVRCSLLVASLAAGVSTLGTPGVARADGEAEDLINACLSSHSEGQVLRMSAKLLESRDAFMKCSASHCPNQIQRDCINWLEQIQLQIPSVGFRVTADGTSRADVKVYIDDKLVLDRLSGKAIDLNPGPHDLRVELEPYEPFKQLLVVSEGDKFRVVEVAFMTPKPVQPAAPMEPTPAETHRPVPLATYIFGGVGIAAAIGGTALGLNAMSLRSDMERPIEQGGCAPRCREDAVNTLKQRALFADISWGVSAASLVTASVFYFLRPERPLEESNPVDVNVSWLPDGGAVGTVTFQGM